MRCRSALVALATAAATLSSTGSAGAVDTVLCAAIPVGTATQNYDNIQGCLDTYNSAVLIASSTYPVYNGIVARTNDVLTGTASTIRFAPSSSTAVDDALLRFSGSSAVVGGITFDADHKLSSNSDIVRFLDATAQPSNNTLQNGAITGGSVPGRTLGEDTTHATGPTAVSFRCTACNGNKVTNVDMYDNYRSVGFHGGANSNANRVELGAIRDNQCDAASFAGYGVLYGNEIYNNGGYCTNEHGGGIYGSANGDGGKIEANDIHDICGHGIDLINGSNYVVKNNTVRDTGQSPVDPDHDYCGAATSMVMYNIRNSTVSGNDMRNTGSPWNMRDHDQAVSVVFADKGATPYSDLPNQERTLMALALVWNGSQTWTTRSNTFTDNVFIASCPETDCLGVPVYAGRGTGVYANQTVDTASRNTFHGTKIAGSETKTYRYGRNAWAPSYVCDSSADWAPTGCNDDDYRWNEPAGSAPNRNDKYHATYSSLPL